jgi:hypothetical protein
MKKKAKSYSVDQVKKFAATYSLFSQSLRGKDECIESWKHWRKELWSEFPEIMESMGYKRPYALEL